MIDTVVLTIPWKHIMEIPDVGSQGWKLHSQHEGYRKFVKNSTKLQKADKVYRPRARLIERGVKDFVQIEFSVPKLMFQNNLDEVSERDFPNVLKVLHKRLEDLGIYTSLTVLRNAEVRAVHYSKNIVLRNGYTATYVISELNKTNLTTRLDLNKDSFRNEGSSLQCYANSHSFVVYDKIQDMNKPKGRATDKEQTPLQFTLFENLGKGKSLTQVLRFESRLAAKRKMKTVLMQIGYDGNYSFESLFKHDISKAVVMKYWSDMMNNKKTLLSNKEFGYCKLLSKVLESGLVVGHKTPIYLVGLQCLRDEGGLRKLRNTLVPHVSKRTWYRISNDIEFINDCAPFSHKTEWVELIEVALKKYEPIRVSGSAGSMFLLD